MPVTDIYSRLFRGRPARSARPQRRRRLAGLETLERRQLLTAQIIEAPSNFQFLDLGYDVIQDEVGIVGYVVDGEDRTATVFELNEDVLATAGLF